MEQVQVFTQVVRELNRMGLRYFLTGSFAVSYYGVPRATHDIDLKVQITTADIPRILATFQKDFYLTEEGVRDACEGASMFNIIHQKTMVKVDWWVMKATPFDRSRMERRRAVEFFDVPTFLSSAEDLLLIKLQWFKDSESEKHWNDAIGIVRLQLARLDQTYLNQWAGTLGVTDLLSRLLKIL